MPDPTPRDLLKQQAAAGGMDNLTIPPIPNIPPPTDPRRMQEWWVQFHAALEQWRQQTNVVLQRSRL